MWAAQWLDLYRHYENGFLFGSGAIADQPAYYLRVMRLIGAAVNAPAEDQK